MAYQPKSYRKFLAGSVSAALVASAVGPVVANAASFSDVNPNDSHAANINALVELGYIKGFNDGTFKPYQSITRGQVAKIFARILEDKGFKAPEKLEQVFDDVPLDAKDQELVKAAAIVKAAGVMTGTDGKLNPGQPITRQQMAKVLVEAFDLTKPADFTSKITDLEKADAYAREYIQTLEANGVTVVTEFKPKDSVTRAAFASFVKRALDAQEAAKAPKVESVSAINSKTVKLTGSALGKLKAEQLSLEGNKILSVTPSEDGKEATVVFEKPFASGKEQVLKLTEKVEGQDDKVTEFKFTYTLEVKEVVATTDRVDNDTDKQYLEFTVNGEKLTVDYLTEAGYTVEFQTTKPAWVNGSTGEFIEDATGVAVGEKFAYRVVISKNGNVVAESPLKEVTVIDTASVAKEITSYKLTHSGDVEIKSGKISLSDTAVAITDVKGTLLNGSKDQALTPTFKSSNEKVAVIDSSGNITPIAPGNVTFTITAGDATVTVPVTIVADERKATSVTATKTSVSLAAGTETTVELTVKDQFGDPVKGFDLDGTSGSGLDITDVKDSTKVIATVSGASGSKSDIEATDENGKTTLYIKADATNTGDGKLEIKDGTTLLSTISVKVGALGTAKTYKLELADASKDTTLDVYTGETKDNEVEFYYNQYNEAGLLMGPVVGANAWDEDGVSGSSDVGTYSVVSSDTNVVDVAVEETTGKIKVTAKKAGTAKVKVLQGTVPVAEVTITVVDSTPKVTAVTFEKDLKITTTDGELDLDTAVLKPSNIALSGGTKSASIDADGKVYIELGTTPGYTTNEDILLGTIKVTSNVVNTSGVTVPVGIVNGVIDAVTGTPATAADFTAGDKGSIVVSFVPNGTNTPLAVETITVDVK
jgi:hypothetical protein